MTREQISQTSADEQPDVSFDDYIAEHEARGDQMYQEAKKIADRLYPGLSAVLRELPVDGLEILRRHALYEDQPLELLRALVAYGHTVNERQNGGVDSTVTQKLTAVWDAIPPNELGELRDDIEAFVADELLTTLYNYESNLGIRLKNEDRPVILDMGAGSRLFSLQALSLKSRATVLSLDQKYMYRYVGDPEDIVLREIYNTYATFADRADMDSQSILGERENIPLPDSSMDLVVLHAAMPGHTAPYDDFDTLHYESEKTLTEIMRVLKPGGVARLWPLVVGGKDMHPATARNHYVGNLVMSHIKQLKQEKMLRYRRVLTMSLPEYHEQLYRVEIIKSK